MKPHKHCVATGNRNYLGSMKKLWTKTGNEGFEECLSLMGDKLLLCRFIKIYQSQCLQYRGVPVQYGEISTTVVFFFSITNVRLFTNIIR